MKIIENYVDVKMNQVLNSKTKYKSQKMKINSLKKKQNDIKTLTLKIKRKLKIFKNCKMICNEILQKMKNLFRLKKKTVKFSYHKNTNSNKKLKNSHKISKVCSKTLLKNLRSSSKNTNRENEQKKN